MLISPGIVRRKGRGANYSRNSEKGKDNYSMGIVRREGRGANYSRNSEKGKDRC